MSGISADQIAAYQRDGAVCLRGVFTRLGRGDRGGDRAQHARARALCRGERAARGAGSFFDDYCNWERIPEFRRVVLEFAGGGDRRRGDALDGPPSSSTTMCWSRSRARRRPRPGIRTSPTISSTARQTVSFWIPIDPVRDATLRLIAGSQHWDKWVLPVRWLDESSFYADAGATARARP